MSLLSKLWPKPARPSTFSFDADIEVLRYARKCVTQFDQLSNLSGEYKRSTVYNKLRRAYPSFPHHELGFAIEVAVRERRCSGS